MSGNTNGLMNEGMNHSTIDGSWFREVNDCWKGFSLSIEVDKILYHEKSDFQDVLVFKSTSFGNVLVLDGIIQCTERDEFTYQEMITHIPMNLHTNPQKVLVIGGGDGGVVREVLKYNTVKEVVLCEIDQVVIDVSRKYLPNMAKCLSDPRVNIQVKDGMAYLDDHQGEFDVIITDAPDPVGPAAALYETEFYKKLKNSLTSRGVISCQGETPFIDFNIVSGMLKRCKGVFPQVGYATGNTPSYVTGIMGYLVATADPNLDLTKPLRRLSDSDVNSMELNYYNSSLHSAAFVLPNYLQRFYLSGRFAAGWSSERILALNALIRSIDLTKALSAKNVFGRTSNSTALRQVKLFMSSYISDNAAQ